MAARDGSSRSSSMTYNPKTGQWSSNPNAPSSNTSSGSPVSNTGQKTSANTATPQATTATDNLVASTDKADSAQGSTEKENNDIEYNVLSGTLNFVANKKTIKIKAGATIELRGLGSTLSGLYYVQDVTRNISSSGYSHSATVIKTDFGNSLKAPVVQQAQQEPTGQAPTGEAPVEQKVEQKTHILQQGECLWSVAKKVYGNGADYVKIAQANGISPSQYTNLPTGMNLMIP